MEIVRVQPGSFQHVMSMLAQDLLDAPEVDVGEWHAMNVSGRPELVSKELQDYCLEIPIPEGIGPLQEFIKPNLPWAEDHFQERVSGKPYNPPPSAEYWPYATGSNSGNDRHKNEHGQFSHTYPERFWSKWAGIEFGDGSGFTRSDFHERNGIRFEYGDYMDLVQLLQKNPYTRQAYLPIWFPEDLCAARNGERVPCTLGYHFMVRPNRYSKRIELNCNYYIRSCDFLRYFQDDAYMAGRLMQQLIYGLPIMAYPGYLNMHISSLHAFQGDLRKLKEMANA